MRAAPIRRWAERCPNGSTRADAAGSIGVFFSGAVGAGAGRGLRSPESAVDTLSSRVCTGGRIDEFQPGRATRPTPPISSRETVFHTLRRFHAFEPQRDGALLGYLRRSLQNRVHDQFRRASRRPRVDPLVDGLDERIANDDESPLDVVIGHGDRRRYEAALKRLRPIDRRAIIASIELGYTYEQLALVLDKPSAPAARLAVRRALIRLGDEMRGA